MFLLDPFHKVLFLLFLVLSMLSIGMETGMGNLRAVFSAKTLLTRALLVNFIVVPALGIVIAFMIPLDPSAEAALLLLACTPGGLSAIQFTKQAQGMATLAGALMFLLTALAVFVSPWLLLFVLPEGVVPVVQRGSAMLFIVAYLFLPLVAGMLISSRRHVLAGKLVRPTALLGVVAFVLFMVLTAGGRRAAVADIGGTAVGAMLLFILLSLTAGWLLGGPARESRMVVATATSMRNAAFCLAIANATPQGDAVLVPLVAFSLLMVPPNMLFTVYNAVRARRRSRL